MEINLLNCDGKRFSAIISDVQCEGMMSVERGVLYLCQNKQDGNRCSDLKGYDFSWNCGSAGTIENLRAIGVVNFKLIDDTVPVQSIRDIALEKAKEFHLDNTENIDIFINAWELGIEWYKTQEK